MRNLSMKEMARRIGDARSIILTTHSGPDGDGLGCLAALASALESHGRTVLRLLPDPLPARYRFLDPEGAFQPLDRVRAEAEARDWDLAIVLDTHEWNLLTGVGAWLRQRSIPTAFLDHHPYEGPLRSDVYGDTDAVATGMLVYHLLVHHLGWSLTPAEAEAIYTSISFDTNSFKYIRDEPSSLLVAADLITRGANTTRVYRNLFASNPLRKARLLGWVLTAVEFGCEGRLAWVKIPYRLISQMELDRDDLRDAVNHILEIDGVEVALTLKEVEPRSVKVSLRSKGTVEIGAIAMSLGGGGHALAAGCEINADLETALAKLTEPLTQLLGAPLEATAVGASVPPTR